MASQDERVDHQDSLVTSMETASSSEPPFAQEEERYADQEGSDQVLLAPQNAEHKDSPPQEQERLEGEIDAPLREALEPVDVPTDSLDDEMSSRMPTEQPARDTVVVAFEQPETADE